MPKTELIVKDNALVNASYNLSVVEQRLILLAIVLLRENVYKNPQYLHDKKFVKIAAENYINTFNVNSSTAYQGLKDACRTLFLRQFSYQEQRENGFANVTTRWVQKIAYVDNSAIVELTFSDDVMPLVLHLEKHLTSYELKQVSNLTSKYAIRLYELLICWRSTAKTPVIELNELRKKIGMLDTEYPRVDNFKARVIDPAIKQINTHTDIVAQYQQQKKGRAITGFSFSFKQKLLEQKTNLKLTEKQIRLLAYDSEFTNEYAKIGESHLELEQRLVKNLKDKKFVLKIYKHLNRLGFFN